MKESKTVVNPYEDVDIEDSMDKIFVDEQPEKPPKKDESKSETTESKKDIDESKEKQGEGKKETEEIDGKKEDEGEGEDKKYTFGENEYTETEIKQAIEDSNNKKDWQKENTQKAQETADLRRAIEPLIELKNKFKDSPEIKDLMRDTIISELGEDAGKLFDIVLDFNEEKHPHPSKKEIIDKDEKIADLEAINLINEEKEELIKKFKITKEKANKVLEVAIKKFEDSGGKNAISLEDQYLIMDREVQKNELEKEKKKEPKIPDVPHKEKSAKDIKKKETYKDYEDIPLDGVGELTIPD